MKNLAFWISATALISGVVAIASRTRDEGRMPDLDGAVAWLNSTPLSSKALRGKVVPHSHALVVEHRPEGARHFHQFLLGL